MSYSVIARKFRPQNFNELIGQNHVGQTLINAIKNNRLHHAILLTGPRGTGKTSTARILAKSLRCTNAQDFVPCNICDDCLAIQQGNHVDVLEIDGASNNGVDAIRQLRDNVQYTAASGTYKVYIIDEVHMLSGSAFNALLKTLEEPPSHVIFLMATTEAHKIPLTILSRCQRYDFRRISTRLIAQHLSNICQQESVTSDQESLWLIAKQGDGSMRDAQSLLDQVITFLGNQLNYEDVVSALGLSDRVLVWDAYWACIERDSQKMLQLLGRLQVSGVDPKIFFEEWLDLIRMTLLIQIDSEKASQLLDIADGDFKSLEQISRATQSGDLHILFDMAQKGIQDILTSFEPRLVFDVVLLRMAQAPSYQSIHSLLNGSPLVATPSQAPKQTLSQAPAVKSNAAPVATTHAKSLAVSPERWLEFIEKLRGQDPVFAAKVEPLVMKQLEGKKIELSIPKQYSFLKLQFQSPELVTKLQHWLKQIWEQDYEVKVTESSLMDGVSAVQVAQQKQQHVDEQILQQMLAHPTVKAASSVLKGKVKLLYPQSNKGDQS